MTRAGMGLSFICCVKMRNARRCRSFLLLTTDGFYKIPPGNRGCCHAYNWIGYWSCRLRRVVMDAQDMRLEKTMDLNAVNCSSAHVRWPVQLMLFGKTSCIALMCVLLLADM